MKLMNHKYLKETQYNWTKDPRKLKINQNEIMVIPEARCFHCGRIFLNADHAIVYCRDCDKAMSVCKDGYNHDFDTWGNKIEFKDGSKIKLTGRREVRTPIEFIDEPKYFDKNNKTKEEPHFVTAAGKILSTEYDSEYQERLYDMQRENQK